MGTTDYRFAERLCVPAPPARVHEVLVDLERYPEWWPAVRAVRRLSEDRALVVCRSRLPYDLELELTARSRSQELLEVGITGNLEGTARWRLRPTADGGTALDYEQQVRARGAALTLASYAARPVLRWNHDAMMRRCREGLLARVATRQPR